MPSCLGTRLLAAGSPVYARRAIMRPQIQLCRSRLLTPRRQLSKTAFRCMGQFAHVARSAEGFVWELYHGSFEGSPCELRPGVCGEHLEAALAGFLRMPASAKTPLCEQSCDQEDNRADAGADARSGARTEAFSRMCRLGCSGTARIACGGRRHGVRAGKVRACQRTSTARSWTVRETPAKLVGAAM